MGAHEVLAMTTQTPELYLSPEEGEKLAAATLNVSRHYTPKSTQKVVDWTALGMVAFGVYSGRFVAIGLRRKQEQGERGGTVVPFDRVKRAQATRAAEVAPPPGPPIIQPDEFE